MDNRKGTEMNKVYIVYGDNGFEDHGATVFGMYPTEDAAKRRVEELEDLYEKGEDGAKFLSYNMVQVGHQGTDFRLQIGG